MAKKHNLHAVVEELMSTLHIVDPIEKKHYREKFVSILRKHKAFDGRCVCCGRPIPVSAGAGYDKGHVCRSNDCMCKHW